MWPGNWPYVLGIGLVAEPPCGGYGRPVMVRQATRNTPEGVTYRAKYPVGYGPQVRAVFFEPIAEPVLLLL